MANEIKLRYPPGLTVYAILRNDSLQVYDGGDEAFEEQGTWDAARVGECAIALTETAATAYGWYVGDFPAVAAGRHYVEYFEQAGASPGPADALIAGETWFWSGTQRLYGNVDGWAGSNVGTDSPIPFFALLRESGS